MILFDPHRAWTSRGLCVGADPEWFFGGGSNQLDRQPTAAAQALWDRAKGICHNCPVLESCRRDTLGEEYGVWGGLDQHQRWNKRRKLPREVNTWPKEQRLAWGERLTELRADGLILRDITLLTGFLAPLIERLIKEWQDREIAPEPEPQAMQLPELPHRSRHRPDFPETPGDKHAWVRHDTRVADGWYICQTPDQKWFRFTCFSGRGQVQKWFSAEDVLFYRPVEPVVREYAGRPDRPGKPKPLRRTATKSGALYCPQNHPYTEANTHRDQRGWRQCRICNRVRQRRRKESRRADAQPPVALVA